MSIWAVVSSALWNPWLFILFFAAGAYFSFRTGFFQVFEWKLWLGRTMGPLFRRKQKQAAKGRLTQFQAMATALGATVGTSTIAGVATAIYFGGPGAVFWMWVSAFLGMMTGYAEKTMAIRYRKRDKNGNWKGGPSEYMTRGVKSKFLAKFFCVACILTSFSGGNLVQSNSIASGMNAAFGVDTHIVGVAISAFVAVVIIGGIGRIGKVSSTLVPVMALLFTSGGVVVLAYHYAAIPAAMAEIVTSAFSTSALLGGSAGYGISAAMRYGVARGVFTNEAGMGSSAMAHAVADVESEDAQGLWGILEVFVATLVIATTSALVIMTSGVYRAGDALRTIESGLVDPDMVGVPLVVRSFETVMGGLSGPFIAICLTLFAVSSILGWSYYGERCLEELTGSNRGKTLYRILFIGLLMVGCCIEVEIVWEIADLCNGLMALPNLIALLILSPQVIAIWKEARAKEEWPKKRRCT